MVGVGWVEVLEILGEFEKLEDPRSLSWTWGGTSNEDLRNEK